MIRENNLSWNESLGPLSVCFVQIYVLLFSGLSFWYQSRTCSYAAFTCFLAYVQLSSLFQFPLAAGDNGLGVAVATQLIVASANTPHSFFVQMLMAVSVLINALASSVFSYPDGGIQAILPTISAYTGKTELMLLFPTAAQFSIKCGNFILIDCCRFISKFQAAFLFYEVGSLLYFSTGKIDIFKSKGISAAQLKSSNNWNWKQNWSLVAPVGIVGVLFLYGMMVEVLRGLHQDGYAENGQQKLLMTLILGAGGFCLVSFRQGFATTRNGTDNESFVPHVNLDKAFEDEDLSHLLYEHTVELRHRMYGDFVTVPFATISTFILCYDCLLFLQENEYDLKVATGPLLTCATLALMSFCSFWSFWYESWTASYAAFASRIALSVVVCLYHWPTQDSHLLPTQFIWHLFILTANTPHSFFNKMAMSLVDVISVVTLSYLSPVNTIPKNLTVILISMGK